MLHVAKRIRCHVYVDGKELEEYNVETKGRHIQCFIAGEEGKEYCVKVHNDAYANCDENTLVADLIVDGKHMMGSVIDYPLQTSLYGKRDQYGNMHPLIFNRLMTTDTDARKAPSLPNLSTITVVVRQMKITRRMAFEEQHPNRGYGLKCANDGQDFGPIDSELPSTAEFLATELGKTFADHNKAWVFTNPLLRVDEEDHSTFGGQKLTNEYVKFTFQYRSRDVLEASGIIPFPEIAIAADDVSHHVRELLKNIKQEDHQTAHTTDATDTQMTDPTPDDDQEDPTARKKRPLMVLRSSSSSSHSSSDEETQKKSSLSPRPRKVRKVTPTEGVMIDLEADGGPTESRYFLQKPAVEKVDLCGIAEDEGGRAVEGEQAQFGFDDGGLITRIERPLAF
ncbi:hypothetical protein HK097_007956 [Rhizophlyctis rosea]|uniref:DUF7918 domain-containing protein n=1 Tax=Rhizophlyctis rosea TaxID=64517 RepID=A0AAD5X5L0_9FUNG|nr:hypothetical protein HK097_007956 [Rhizophlyctis rosea]